VIVDDLYIVCFRIPPRETNPPAIVDPDAVCAGAVVFELLQAIAWRNLQVIQSTRSVQIEQFPPGNPLKLLNNVEQADRRTVALYADNGTSESHDRLYDAQGVTSSVIA
jgi:hypothetical protein